MLEAIGRTLSYRKHSLCNHHHPFITEQAWRHKPTWYISRYAFPLQLPAENSGLPKLASFWNATCLYTFKKKKACFNPHLQII